MSRPVKTRSYRSPRRAEQARQTRRAVLTAARELFATHGYRATTVTAIAGRAGVSVDTLYASVGRKPEIVLAVIDSVLGSSADALEAGQRDHVRAIRAAPDAAAKIQTYAAALGRLLPAVAPLQDALRRAGETDPRCARVSAALGERRAANMALFAADLRSTGEVRADLTDAEVADIVWSTNAVEYYLLLAGRGWSPERFARHLVDLWTRLLLEHPAAISG